MKRLFFVLLLLLFTVSVQSQTFNELYTKADSLFGIKQYDASLDYALKAMNYAIKKEGRDSKPYATALNLIGVVYFKKGDYDKAVFYFTLEKEAKKQIFGPDSPNYAKTLNNLSSVLSQLGRNREAEPIMREALELKRKTVGAYDTSYATSAHNLAVMSFNLGNLNDAERYFLIAAKIRKKRIYENKLSYANTVKNLGSLYKVLGNYSAAEKNLTAAYNIYKDEYGENSTESLDALSELAVIYLASGRGEEAKPLLEKVQSELKTGSDGSYIDYLYASYNIAMYYWSKKNYAEAEKLLMKIMNDVDQRMGNGHPLFSSCLNSLGLIYWQSGDLNNAMINLSMAEELRRKMYGRYHPDYATSLHNLAALQKELGYYDQAAKNYTEASNLYIDEINKIFPYLSESEKAKFYANLQERFDLFNLYVLSRMKENPGLLSDMYNYRLITKGILLNTSRKIRRKIMNSNNPELIAYYNQWRAIKENLSRLYSMTIQQQTESGKNIIELEEKANSLEKILSEKSNVFKKDLNNQEITWLDVQRSLNPDEAAIEIIRINMFDRQWLDTAFYAVLIVTKNTRGNPDIVLLSNGYYLDNHYINNYLNSIRFQIEDKYSYPVFWEKIEQKLNGIKKVYLSQDGVYNKININTLQKMPGKYVVDDMNIIVVSKTSDIIGKKKRVNNRTAYLFGNPKYAMSEEEINRYKSVDERFPIGKINYGDLAVLVPDLPGTQKEIKEIETLLTKKRWKTTTLQGVEADEKAFKEIKQAEILHLATHGYFIKNIPVYSGKSVYGIDIAKASDEPMLRSGLLFAGASNFLTSENNNFDDKDNGILTAYEAASLEFDNIDLLVLSACETGLGEIKNGEGVYGLQRAFQIAGTKNLIMSLWKVNDDITQQLMTYFYQNRLNGSNTEDALRKAQLTLKKEWEHPYYWGGFILIKN